MPRLRPVRSNRQAGNVRVGLAQQVDAVALGKIKRRTSPAVSHPRIRRSVLPDEQGDLNVFVVIAVGNQQLAVTGEDRRKAQQADCPDSHSQPCGIQVCQPRQAGEPCAQLLQRQCLDACQPQRHQQRNERNVETVIGEGIPTGVGDVCHECQADAQQENVFAPPRDQHTRRGEHKPQRIFA